MRVLALGILALALVAAPAAHAANATITASNVSVAFNPTDVTVNTGDTVTVAHAAGLGHTAAWDDLVGQCPVSGSGGAWSCPRMFTEAGTYTLYCGIHGHSMTSTVHVNPVVYTWNGADGDNWTDTTKWLSSPDVSGTYPGGHAPSDKVVIDNGTSPTLDLSLTIGALTLDTGGGRKGGGHLTVAGGDTAWGNGALAGTGTTTIGPDSHVTLGGDLTMDGNAVLENAGNLTMNGVAINDNNPDVTDIHNLASGIWTIAGSIQNTVTPIFQNDGALIVPPTKSVLFNGTTAGLNQAGGQLQVDGTLTKTGGSIIVGGGTVAGGGTLAGAVTNTGGTVAPGSSPGTLAMTSYDQQPGGTLEIELDGTGHDVLAVSGVANLAGTLAIVSDPAFHPVATDTFDFLTTADRQATFTQVTGAQISGATYVVNYEATRAFLSVVLAPVDNTPPTPTTTTPTGTTTTPIQCCTAPRQIATPTIPARVCAAPVAGFAACILRPTTFAANGCVPRRAGIHRFVVKLRKTSRNAKRGPRITLVTFKLNGKAHGTDRKAPFAALVKGSTLTPRTHVLAADVRLQNGKKKVRKKVAFRFTACG